MKRENLILFELRPVAFEFACTTADLAEALPSSTAFFTITYWIISDEYFTSAMTWKTRGRSLAVTSGTHFFYNCSPTLRHKWIVNLVGHASRYSRARSTSRLRQSIGTRTIVNVMPTMRRLTALCKKPGRRFDHFVIGALPHRTSSGFPFQSHLVAARSL